MPKKSYSELSITFNQLLYMQIKILAFGIAKEIVGGSTAVIALPEAPTVENLRGVLAGQYPALEQLASLAIAVNGTYATDDQCLQPNDEVVLIPPVSGG